jgi:hypothetical protein
MISNYFNRILSDLFESDPLDPDVLNDPYDEIFTVEQNAYLYQRLIRSSTIMKDRQGTLLYAYYFGNFLTQRITLKDARKCRRIIAQHYIDASQRTYRLFSILGPQHIYRTHKTTLVMVRRISAPQFHKLIDEALSLIAGAIN